MTKKPTRPIVVLSRITKYQQHNKSSATTTQQNSWQVWTQNTSALQICSSFDVTRVHRFVRL